MFDMIIPEIYCQLKRLTFVLILLETALGTRRGRSGGGEYIRVIRQEAPIVQSIEYYLVTAGVTMEVKENVWRSTVLGAYLFKHIK